MLCYCTFYSKLQRWRYIARDGVYAANLSGAGAAATQPVGESTLNLTGRINMLEYDEKRNYIRMEIDCDITYKLADSDEVYRGRCSSLSGAGVSFITNR